MKLQFLVLITIVSLTACSESAQHPHDVPHMEITRQHKQQMELIDNILVKDLVRITELKINLPELNDDYLAVLSKLETNPHIRYYPYASKLLIEELNHSSQSGFSMELKFKDGLFVNGVVLSHSVN